MRSQARAIILLPGFLFLSGCSQITISPMSTAGGMDSSPYSMDVTTAVEYQTPTFAVSPTITRTATTKPTDGPPPDLELKNVTIYPQVFDPPGQTYYLLGRVKNNTDNTMVFFPKDTIFEFTFESWQHFTLENYFQFIRYKDEAKLGVERDRIMNCILYPGDEGVFVYGTDSSPSQDRIMMFATPSTHEGPLGIWYTYKSYYRNKPTLPLKYHPKAENIVYTINKGEIDFDYDVIGIPKSEDYRLISWILLYDSSGKILNIFTKRLNELPGLLSGKDFHVHGSTSASKYDQENYFYPAVELTPDMVERLDQLEVFNEFEEGRTCSILSES